MNKWAVYFLTALFISFFFFLELVFANNAVSDFLQNILDFYYLVHF